MECGCDSTANSVGSCRINAEAVSAYGGLRFSTPKIVASESKALDCGSQQVGAPKVTKPPEKPDIF